MSAAPEVSVVMGVYNGGCSLAATINSILSQTDVSLEFIIVNDGSTDQTPDILEDYARRDSRVKLIHQQNQGLTKSLINGCAAAQGPYIARQDAGDISLPGRLSKQLHAISSDPEASFISCGARFVGPEREQLYEVVPDDSDLTAPLLTIELNKLRGPSMHGCTLFPKERYDRVGGYRTSFYFAQDLDLWVRLAEIGKHIAIKDVLYEASITIGSISSRYRKHQVGATRLIMESARRRRKGVSDEGVLELASHIKSKGQKPLGRIERARALYFIGACLRRRRSPHAPSYFHRALLAYPLHIKSALRLLTG